MTKKFVCMKQGCNFSTESQYDSEQHQKQGPGHDILAVERDVYSGKIKEDGIDQDME